MRLLNGKLQYVLGEEQRDLRDSRVDDLWRAVTPAIVEADVDAGHSSGVMLADASAAPVMVILPDARRYKGPVVVKKIDSSPVNAVRVVTVGGQTVDGQSFIELTAANSCVVLIPHEGRWFIIGGTAGA